MNQFLSKISLYDFLTTILLGGCLYYSCRLNGWFDGILIQPDVVVIGICYIVGLLTHKFIEIFDFSSIINKCAVRKVFFSVILSPICRNQLSIIRMAMEDDGLNFNAKQILENYYKAYYKLMMGGSLYNIPQIEAHSAFIRDLIFVFPLIAISIAVFYKRSGSMVAWIIIFAIIIELLLFVARYCTEKKIHTLVWEIEKYKF